MSTNLDKETLDDYASIMEKFGLAPQPTLSPEEEFFQYLTAGQAPRVDMMVYWLRDEMCHLDHMNDAGIKVTVRVMKEGQQMDRPITRFEYAKSMVIYYLQMHHLTRFLDDQGRLKQEPLETVAKMFLEYPAIKKVVNLKN